MIMWHEETDPDFKDEIIADLQAEIDEETKYNLKYHFKIHKEDEGYWAECIELNGCVTQGDTLEELHHNIREALQVYLQEPEGPQFHISDLALEVTVNKIYSQRA